MVQAVDELLSDQDHLDSRSHHPHHLLHSSHLPHDGRDVAAGDSTKKHHSKPRRSFVHPRDIESLVVSTPEEYVTMAIKLTHQPKLREYYMSNILQRRSKLFDMNPQQWLLMWKKFLFTALTSTQ